MNREDTFVCLQSEEDRQLQDDLLMLVERLQVNYLNSKLENLRTFFGDDHRHVPCVFTVKESQTDLYGPTLESLRTLIRSSTSSMTSVPKPLKFLRPHYDKIKSLYETWNDEDLKVSSFVSHVGVSLIHHC